MRTKSSLTALALLVFAIGCLICGAAKAETAPVWRVGAILPLSGEGASWGQAIKNGIELAREKFSPQAKERIHFLYEDDMFLPRNSLSALNRLLVDGPLDAVINVSTATGIAIAPLCEERKIALFSIATGQDISRGRKYAFNFWVTPEEEGRVLIPEALRRGIRRMARVSTIQEGVLAGNAAIDRENGGRIEMVLSEDYPPDARDFRTVIAKIRGLESRIDGLMLVLLPGQLGVFARQARSLGIKTPFFGLETLEDLNELRAAAGTLEGAWYVNAGDGDGAFLRRYKERYPEASTYAAGNGHDAALLLAAALDRGYPRNKIHEFLANLKGFSGALGVYSSTGDQRFSLPAVVKVATKDGFETVK